MKGQWVHPAVFFDLILNEYIYIFSNQSSLLLPQTSQMPPHIPKRVSGEFYNVIGESLYTMKNSPFMRLDQNSKPMANPVAQASADFEPDRLFNPEKHKKRQLLIEDKQLTDAIHKQEHETNRLQYDMLRKNINEDYQRKVEKMQAELIRNEHKCPYSIFGVYRGMCLLCQKCVEYEGVFSSNLGELQSKLPTQKLDFMECRKCGCPMNSHIPSYSKNPYQELIWKHLIKYDIQDQNLSIAHIVLAFKVHRKNASEQAPLIDLLQQLGCHVIDHTLLTQLSFEIRILKSILVKDGIEKGYLQTMLNLLDCIQTQQEWNWQNKGIGEFYQQLYPILQKLAFEYIVNSMEMSADERVFVVLAKCDNPANIIPFMKSQMMREESRNYTFVWGSRGKKQSLICSQLFFPRQFMLKYRIFLMPGSYRDQRESEHSSARLNDILDYNNYLLFIEDPKNIDRFLFEQAFKQFHTNKFNFILGEQILSDKIKKVKMKLGAKVGNNTLSIPTEHCPDFLTISARTEIERALRVLYPQFTYSQRCVIIIRPFVLVSNYEEILVNILRLNNFILLKRIKKKLTETEAAYLGTLEQVSKDKITHYIEFMTSGVCEIVLVSKRSAIYDAHALTHGCINGPTHIPSKILKNRPVVQMKKGRETYEYEINPVPSSAHSPHIFYSLKSLINIQNALFGDSTLTKGSQYARNAKTGEIIKLTEDRTENLRPDSSLKVSTKQRESLLRNLPSDPFNYWIFTSKSEIITEELVLMFLPECTLFEPITVLVKPGATHLTPLIRKALIEHKYHIIAEKTVQFSRASAQQLIVSLQKIQLSKETLKGIIDCYSTQSVHILCLSKVSSQKEIMAMLSDFEFLISSTFTDQLSSRSSQTIGRDQHYGMVVDEDYLSDKELAHLLVPVWNSEEICLEKIAHPLGNLEQAVKMLVEGGHAEQGRADMLKVLNYLVGSFYGVYAEDLELNTKLGKLCYYIAEEFAPKQQSWYYATISINHPNYVPLLFQYRPIGQTILCMQSGKGWPFMTLIQRMHEEERAKMVKLNEEADQFGKQKKRTHRRSLVLFLWAKKLAEFALTLSEVTTELKDFGEIEERNGEYRGSMTSKNASQQEHQFLTEMDDQLQEYPQIRKNIRKLINSRCLQQRYMTNNLRLIPSFCLLNLDECVRVVQKTDTLKLHLMDRHSFIDPENQSFNMKDLYSLNLYNVMPEIRTKYSLIAELYMHLIRGELESPDLQTEQLYHELSLLFIGQLASINEIQVLEYQIYLKYMLQFSRASPDSVNRKWALGLLRSYPNLKNAMKFQTDEIAGKKRKFLQHKQYFARTDEHSQQMVQKRQKYLNVDISKFSAEPKPSALYNPDDQMHRKFATTHNNINLLRESEGGHQREGIYVEFEKNISEKQELLRDKIKREVEKFNVRHDDQIIHETGLEKQLWYRRTKGEPKQSAQSKTNQAIQKQISRLIAFKKSETNKEV